MNQDEHKIVVRRMAGLIAAASVLIAVYVLRLIFLQLVNSDSFKAQATNTTDYNFTVTAARGDIVDSAGRRIAASTTSYNVVLSKLLMGDEDLDTMLQRIVDLLEAHGERWNDSLLIGEPDAAGHYSFTAQADSTSDQKALAAMKELAGLAAVRHRRRRDGKAGGGLRAGKLSLSTGRGCWAASTTRCSSRRFPTSTTSSWPRMSAK